MYVPEFVALYEIVPYIEYLVLDNESIRVAVKDYLEGQPIFSDKVYNIFNRELHK